MVAKCANPSCNSPFRYLRGKLFLVDKPPFMKAANSQGLKNPSKSEYFWLCESCILTMTVTRGPSGQGIVASRAHLSA
jgi:hypothetical protein